MIYFGWRMGLEGIWDVGCGMWDVGCGISDCKTWNIMSKLMQVLLAIYLPRRRQFLQQRATRQDPLFETP